MRVDASKSLNQMYGQPNGTVSDNDDDLAVRYESAMASPLQNLDVSDLQMLLRQDDGWEFIIPYVLDMLQENFAAEHYGERLLDVLLHRPEDPHWRDHPKVRDRAVKLLYDNEDRVTPSDLDAAIFFIEKNSGDRAPNLSFWGESPGSDGPK